MTEEEAFETGAARFPQGSAVTPEGEQPGAAAPSPEGDPAPVDEAPVVEEAPQGDEADGVEEAVAEPGTEADELTVTRIALEERTLDLQRLQAEYLNYKRRVERDRELIKENATYSALTPIIDVLDTIDRARDHEPLDGGFKAVAEQLERVVAGLGLVKFGEPGDAFDPTVHEALSHIGVDPEVEVTTCKVIAKAGYKIGDRVVRAAQVLVVDPADD
ncbi:MULTISPECIES: nucleotide exchange factor GrpE [Nocardioides]|uniref:Protein GrpE n=1 Tax=Nocardioides vastitatis TaxID=2568655 RepID=A0ABW0ZDW7_9ACTN|nr:nucleotide exchange factor GrpE [Nocardioides sp.]THI95467.1 nucleotide exchange factor GrpE [Nocardioides sp.]